MNAAGDGPRSLPEISESAEAVVPATRTQFYTNRSPYPMLHLLREASVARAVESDPAADRIGENNIATLRRLGHEGCRQLWIVT